MEHPLLRLLRRACRSQHRLAVVDTEARPSIDSSPVQLPAERHREPADQTFGAPVKIGAAAELRFDAGDDAARAKAARDRLLDFGAVALLPDELQDIGLHFPFDASRRGDWRQRA